MCLPFSFFLISEDSNFLCSGKNDELSLTCVTPKLSAVRLSLRFSFLFSISLSSKHSNWTLPASQLGTNSHQGQTQMGRSNTSLLFPVRLPTGVTWQWHRDSRVGCRREGCDELPWFHTINYPDITSPVTEDSAGKGQPSGLHKDQLAMHVTAPAGPASARPASQFRDMTNAWTRLLIAPKMPEQCLLMLL